LSDIRIGFSDGSVTCFSWVS